ncbi:MAG: hypothetical protein COB85_06525 [Bacteroidetes bacterium]|nr:MAG: hypothetical protein COB85_06525 [Bacteroidota bacterium]
MDLRKIDPYFGMTPANCLPDNCFCEAVRYGEWIRQPADTWSNLAFIFVSIVIIWMVYYQKPETRNNLAQNPSYSWLFALASFLTGVGSFYYHASLTFMSQWFDVMGMYFSVTFFIIYNLDRLRKLGPTKVYASYFAINILLGVLLVTIPEARRYLFGSFLFLLLFSVYYSQVKLKTEIRTGYLYWAIACFAVAFGLWILDIKHIVCVPDSLFQLHAVWHCLSALSGFFIYMYYRSEDAKV